MIHYLASYPKSGNTWVRLMLAHYHGWTDFNNLGAFAWQDVADWAYDKCAARPGHYNEFESIMLKPAALLHLVTMLQCFGNKVWLKTHGANLTVSGIPQFPPELTSKITYIVRDPRDVAIAYAYHMVKTVDEVVEEMAKPGNTLMGKTGIRQILGTWSEHVYSWHQQEKAIVVRYEDLCDDPAAEMRRILDHNEVEVDEARIQAAIEATTFDRLQAFESETGFKEAVREQGFFRRGTYGQWRRDLTAEQVERIENEHHDMMEAMGYEIQVCGQRSA